MGMEQCNKHAPKSYTLSIWLGCPVSEGAWTTMGLTARNMALGLDKMSVWLRNPTHAIRGWPSTLLVAV